MDNELMRQGVELMLFGMGTVFIFLALLVVVTSAMSTLIQRFAKPEPVISAQPPRVQAAASNDQQLVAVITAAIHKYRSRHK